MKQELLRPVISTIVDPYTSIFEIWKTFAQMFDSLKIQNVSNFYCEKRTTKKLKFFMFLRGRYFLMGNPININVSMFWETSVGFLKCVVLQLFPKYGQSYVNLNVKGRAKFYCLYKVDGLF